MHERLLGDVSRQIKTSHPNDSIFAHESPTKTERAKTSALFDSSALLLTDRSCSSPTLSLQVANLISWLLRMWTHLICPHFVVNWRAKQCQSQLQSKRFGNLLENPDLDKFLEVSGVFFFWVGGDNMVAVNSNQNNAKVAYALAYFDYLYLFSLWAHLCIILHSVSNFLVSICLNNFTDSPIPWFRFQCCPWQFSRISHRIPW